MTGNKVRRLVVAGFAVLVVGLAGGPFQGKLSTVQRNGDTAFLPASAASTQVAVAAKAFGQSDLPGSVVFYRPGGLRSNDIDQLTGIAERLKSLPGVAGAQVSGPQLSPDRELAVISVPLQTVPNGTAADDRALVNNEKRVVATAKSLAPRGVVVHGAGVAGQLTAVVDAFSGLESTLLFVAVGVVILILLAVYRSPVLWIFPLLSALLALGAAALVVYPLARHGVLTLNGQSQGILSVLVIGAGTDYALLLISRYREELHRYPNRGEALWAAWRGAVRPIVASASTVICGLLCLLLGELNSDRSLGPVCAIGIAATAVVMLTVLPLFLLLGRWIFWPRVPRADRPADVSGRAMDAVSPLWTRLSDRILRANRPLWIGSTVVLAGLAVGIVSLDASGIPAGDAFTRTPDAVVGQRLVDTHFPAGNNAPVLILADVAQAPQVIEILRRTPGVAPATACIAVDYGKLAAAAAGSPPSASRSAGCAPPQYQVSPVNGRILITASLTVPYDSTAAFDTIRSIRQALARVPAAHARVGGQTAITLDTLDAAAHDRNLIIPVVLVVITVILGLVLRAFPAALLLLATVVLSFAATLGVCALVFRNIFHFPATDPSFPLYAFIFLVALGVDYNIFLLTRVREEILRLGLRGGITRGLAATGGVITSAGIVLAATFAVLGVVPLVALVQVGFAVAFGVLLDTMVVRAVLVPALLSDVGPRAWWPTRA